MLTTQERRAAAFRQNRLISSRAATVTGLLAREKNQYIRACAASYARTSHFNERDFYKHESAIKEILYSNYLKIGRLIHSSVAMSFKAQRGGVERKSQSIFEYNLLKWAERNAGAKAKRVAGTTKKDINRAVQKAFKEELPEKEVIKRILTTRGYSNFRADAVARTETHNAAMFASKETAVEYAKGEGVAMKKIWTPSDDDRSREFHREMESHPAIGMTELFEVPNPDGGTDAMDRPGDPTAPAVQVVACRCILTYDIL